MTPSPRAIALTAAAVAALACGLSEPDPIPAPDEAPVAAPAPDDAPAKRKGKHRGRRKGRRGAEEGSKECTVGMTGVLTGIPGFRPGEGGYEAADYDVAVRNGPGVGDATIATLTPDGIVNAKGKKLCSRDDCAYLTWTYEGQALPAYENRSGFVHVGFGTGGAAQWGEGTCPKRGWVGMDVPLTYRPLAELLNGRLVSFYEWDKLVSDAPGEAGRKVSTAGVIEVKETRQVGGRLWLRGTLYTNRGCEGDQKRVGEGWVPAHRSDGVLQVKLYEAC